jgi:hypothetical protein
MRRTQRLRACVGSLLLLCSLTLLHAQNENRALPTNAESTRYVSQATIFAQQVETLNPNCSVAKRGSAPCGEAEQGHA